jgi:YARHG domain
LVPMRQPSPKPTARQSPTSRPEPSIVSPTVAPSETPSAFPGERYPQTRERILTEADVASLDSAELRYAINEMYARYGAPFLNQPDIEKQFRAFPWYHPVHDLKLAQIEAYFFSAIEKRNLDILARLRDEKRPK